MEFNEKMPIYLQIVNAIKNDIVIENIKGGDKLPSVREMAEKFRVNPNTIQRVYQELEREEITFTQRGMGTFITQDNNKIEEIKWSVAKELIESFIKGMRDIGYSTLQISDCINEYIKKEEL